RVGQEFTLRITLRNTATGITPLQDIGLDDSLLEGLTVVRSDPPYERQDHLPTGVTTYWYYMDIPPEGSTSITLYLRADRAGTFQGDFTAFSDPGSRTTPISLTITP
ncbi:MAG: hypothetical protein KJ734_09760, partial [Chloroflexi bacterium]|nr:hypothetical protein [Chloroflexota bacterium]